MTHIFYIQLLVRFLIYLLSSSDSKISFPSSSAPPSSSPFSVIRISVHIWGVLFHPFIIYPQEERGAEFQLCFQFHLFIHFMTKIMTPKTKPRCPLICSTVHLFLSDCPSEDILNTHPCCIFLLVCWLTCNRVKVPLHNS